MKKRRINWSWGNPSFSAWAIDYPEGELIVRHNHEPKRTIGGHCEGWDLWLDTHYLGAVGSRPLKEMITLTREQLVSLAQAACCSRHQDYPFNVISETTGRRGGRRPNAGRKPKGDAKRIKLTVTVEPQTFALLEQMRGDHSFGRCLDDLVQTHCR